MNDNVVERARELVGVRFRPQGRRAESGLDCVGLVLQAHEIAGPVPTYQLRGDHVHKLKHALLQYFVEVGPHRLSPGDVLLLQISPQQVHLAIHAGPTFIHADARARRVLEVPGASPWPLISAYGRRLASAS